MTTETVVSGTIPICTHSATVLMDTGSTQSFVSHRFAILLDVPLEELGYVLFVVVSLGPPMFSSHVYRNCKIHVNNRELTVNLIPLAIQHFDVILGMDWLAENHGVIDCDCKVVLSKRQTMNHIHSKELE